MTSFHQTVKKLAEQIESRMIADRRDFHRYAEAGWTEFRTASLVARRLTDLGYQVSLGRDVLADAERMGLPDETDLEAHYQRAVAQGGDPAFLPALRGGFTGVVGTLKNGKGPTLGMRFEMDALDIPESGAPDHRPQREGFASVNPGVMHACGHDAHTAVGLGIAQVLSRVQEDWQGTLKLIFQPAEEGVRGAKAMTAAGVVDDVDLLVDFHFFSGWATDEITPGMDGFSATRKFDVFFYGQPSHAGGSPQAGKNALLAAATAVLNLYAIPRHSSGHTRINVGKLSAGSGRNIIPAEAHLVMETRGENTALSEYMFAQAQRVLHAAAEMYDCRLEIRPMGAAQSASSDRALSKRVEAAAREAGDFHILPTCKSGGSEDVTYMMQRVQKNGGLAVSVGLGADISGIRSTDMENNDQVLRAHTPKYDIHEGTLKKAVVLFSMLAGQCLGAEENNFDKTE
ncbi:MAG: amidohydrolase [Anaerolineaceae bacterium]|jgi:aminobenzoyl-glutamate utilization protein A|nr:amidohydrolase [Anaerolineaceae bacterium]